MTENDLIQGMTFSNCQIVGPALVAPIRDDSFVRCGWDSAGNDPSSLLIEMDNPRWLVGVIGLIECRFYACRFTRVGLVVDSDFARRFRQGWAPRASGRAPRPANEPIT